MILNDFSSVIHRKIHSAIARLKPNKVNGIYVTNEFIDLVKYDIMSTLFETCTQHKSKFGDLVICLDKSDGGYWRKDVYPAYKASRAVGREESEIDFPEVFKHINELIYQLKHNVPWKVVEVSRAEADDIMLILAKEFNQYELILIDSPDKDMLQAQRETENVFQYSALTKKWLVAENKHDNMEHWIMEHVCLGDASDDVPRVIDHTEFSPAFLKYLKEQGYNIKDPIEFKASDIQTDEKKALIENFNVYKLNRKKESTGVKDIYKDIRFGPSGLEKAIKQFGSLDAWLDSHPLYRPHYERNFKLVMEEGIPEHIRSEIVKAYKAAPTDYNQKEFEDYLERNNLNSLKMELPNHFKINRDLTADDFGWD